VWCSESTTGGNSDISLLCRGPGRTDRVDSDPDSSAKAPMRLASRGLKASPLSCLQMSVWVVVQQARQDQSVWARRISAAASTVTLASSTNGRNNLMPGLGASLMVFTRNKAGQRVPAGHGTM